MEYKVVIWRERAQVPALHPELWSQKPELIDPIFSTNPVPMPDDFPYLFYILDDQKIAGYRRAVPDWATIGAERKSWAWNFDLFIEPEYRGRGIGRHLVEKQVEEFARRDIIAGQAFSAPATLRIYDRLGFNILGHAPRMCLVANSRPFLAKRVRNGILASLASGIMNSFLSVEGFVRTAVKRNRRVNVSEVDKDAFASTFAELIDNGSLNHWAEDAQWVLARINADDRLYQVADTATGRALALLVIRDKGAAEGSDQAEDGSVRRATLMHFVLLKGSESPFEGIATALRRYLKESGADVIDVITSAPDFLSVLRANGFRKRGVGMSFVYKLPGGADREQGDGLADWHLTHFASDGFLLA